MLSTTASSHFPRSSSPTVSKVTFGGLCLLGQSNDVVPDLPGLDIKSLMEASYATGRALKVQIVMIVVLGLAALITPRTSSSPTLPCH